VLKILLFWLFVFKKRKCNYIFLLILLFGFLIENEVPLCVLTAFCIEAKQRGLVMKSMPKRNELRITSQNQKRNQDWEIIVIVFVLESSLFLCGNTGEHVLEIDYAF
jgi:hypothetical protein